MPSTNRAVGERRYEAVGERRYEAVGERRYEAGFSLLELLVATLASILVVGGMLMMLNSLQDVHRDSQELIDAQQTARISLDKMQRDIHVAGVGLAWLLPPTPFVLPRADGGIDVRTNENSMSTALAADMAGPNDPFTVDDAAGFNPGMEIAVYDATGAMDFITLTGVDTVNDRLLHGGVSKAYTVIDGTAVARVQTISFFVQDIAAVQTLMRQDGTQAAQPIAANVVQLTITYWDDATPQVQFVPATNGDMLRIHTVEIDLEIQTENVKLNTNQRRSVTLTTRITPRAVVLS